MRRLFRNSAKKVGLPPGTLVHVGQRKADAIAITTIEYDETQLWQGEPVDLGRVAVPKDRPTVTWISVGGLHDVDAVGTLGERFGLHPLVVEDILNTGQRPKVDDYGEYIFVALRSFYHLDEDSSEPDAEQVCLVLGANYVLSFQERAGDEFGPVRDRIRSSKGRVRRAGADYLAYALIDLLVDQYFVVLERFGDRIESLEEELIAEPATETLHAIYHLKREMALLRKSVWPLREVIGTLERSESPLMDASTGLYLRDAYDHTIQVIDAVETFRDMLSGMLDIYLSSVSNRMNEVMKVLTVISTVFIPLTFVVGLYGMNFRYMPELEWPWGYPMVWIAMLVIALLMVVYMRRKRWL